MDQKALQDSVVGDNKQNDDADTGTEQAHEEEEEEEELWFRMTDEQRQCLNLNDETLEAMKDVFRNLDEDSNGTLDISELEDAMKHMNVECTEAEIVELMKQADSDGNGTLDFMEFAGMVSNKMQEYDPERELKEAFAVFDKDGDGKISIDELKTVVESLGGSMTKEELESMLLEADDNSDGYLDYSEFVKIWMGDEASESNRNLTATSESENTDDLNTESKTS